MFVYHKVGPFQLINKSLDMAEIDVTEDFSG